MNESHVNVTATRWELGWELTLESGGVTQSRTLREAQQQVRDYLDTTEPEVDHSGWIVFVAPEIGPVFHDPMLVTGHSTVLAMSTDNIIARRTLKEDGRQYELLIGKPYMDKSGLYICPWSLVDDSSTPIISEWIAGADSVQALLTTLLVLGERLAAESEGFSLAGMNNTGFPRFLDTGDPDTVAWYLPLDDPHP